MGLCWFYHPDFWCLHCLKFLHAFSSSSLCGVGRADPTVGIDSLSQPAFHSSSSARTASTVSMQHRKSQSAQWNKFPKACGGMQTPLYWGLKIGRNVGEFLWASFYPAGGQIWNQHHQCSAEEWRVKSGSLFEPWLKLCELLFLLQQSINYFFLLKMVWVRCFVICARILSKMLHTGVKKESKERV